MKQYLDLLNRILTGHTIIMGRKTFEVLLVPSGWYRYVCHLVYEQNRRFVIR